MNRFRKKSGFTLIELLVVIAIIAVLIALVVGWLAAGTVAEGFTGALGTLADDVVRAWSPAAASQP